MFEDEKSDVLLLQVAFKRAGLLNPVHVAVDGAEAINYLAGHGPFADRNQHPLPALVLLDLNLPKKIRFRRYWVGFVSNLSSTSLPVVIYTSSVGLIDNETARLLGATDYFVKRSGVHQHRRTGSQPGRALVAPKQPRRNWPAWRRKWGTRSLKS